MKFTAALATTLVGATSLLATANAAPAADTLAARDIWTPKILYPHAGTVWQSGQRHNVTWDTSNPPERITDPTNSFITLRTGDIETPVLLVYDFDIRDGRIEITVPLVCTRDDFSLVLWGDSGNWGDDFTIEGPVDC